MRVERIVAAEIGALILLSTFAVSAQTSDGKALYQKKMCFACHGKDGQGGPAGPSVNNLGKSKDELIALVKKGTPKMKPFKGTEEELSAIVDYLLTLK